LESLINAASIKQVSQWNVRQLKFSLLENAIGWLLEMFCLITGVLCILYKWTLSLLSMLSIGDEYVIVRGVIFLFIVSLFSTIIKVPFEVFRLLKIENQIVFPPAKMNSHDLLATPVATSRNILYLWTIEQLKAFVASLAFGFPILIMTVSLLHWDFFLQWFIAAFFVCCACALFSDIYADMLAPWFETTTKLSKEDSREKNLQLEIEALCKTLQVNLSQVYKVATTLKLSHSNAFLMGFGKKKRIVIYDNLLKLLTTKEIIAIVGHEIGHYKFNHLWKKLFIQLVFVGNFIFLFSLIIRQKTFYLSFGFPRIDPSVGLLLFSYQYNSFASFMRLLTNFISRRFEYKADEYAIDHGLEMEPAMIKLHVMHNIASIAPDKLYSIYHFSHPSLIERLQKMETYRKQRIREHQD